jgi:hypothetical protein
MNRSRAAEANKHTLAVCKALIARGGLIKHVVHRVSTSRAPRIQSVRAREAMQRGSAAAVFGVLVSSGSHLRHAAWPSALHATPRHLEHTPVLLCFTQQQMQGFAALVA